MYPENCHSPTRKQTRTGIQAFSTGEKVTPRRLSPRRVSFPYISSQVNWRPGGVEPKERLPMPSWNWGLSWESVESSCSLCFSHQNSLCELCHTIPFPQLVGTRSWMQCSPLLASHIRAPSVWSQQGLCIAVPSSWLSGTERWVREATLSPQLGAGRNWDGESLPEFSCQLFKSPSPLPPLKRAIRQTRRRWSAGNWAKGGSWCSRANPPCIYYIEVPGAWSG